MRSRSPGGQSERSDHLSNEIGEILQQEFILCSRLAGEALANALFVADAHIAEACSPTLSPATRKALASARTAISQAARSGLVLLTSSKPGLEPIEHLDIDRTFALAKTMLRRIDPQSPDVEIVKRSERIPLVRLPIGLPCRLLIRSIACFPTARRIQVELAKHEKRGLEKVTIEISSDVRPYDGWLPHITELLERPGGSLSVNENVLHVELPACWAYETETSGTDAFMAGPPERNTEGTVQAKDLEDSA